MEDQARLGETHPWSRHPFFQYSENEKSASWLLYSPELQATSNSDFPFGWNDGPIWQGRGWNGLFSAGGAFRHRYVEAAVRPIVAYSENRAFDLSHNPPFEGLSPYAMAQTNADLPQRFGEESITKIYPGESYVKVRYSGWNAGLSTQRMKIGPAVTHPLLLGYSAPGFPHVFTGTEEAKKALRGWWEGRIFWGGLQESDYFDEDPSNNLRFITGFTFSYSPEFARGFSIGFARTAVSYYPDGGLSVGDLLMAFSRLQPKNEELDRQDARFIKSSIFARYHLPESGIEAYAEWGRNDNRRRVRDVLAEPELNRGYLLGFIKRFNVGDERRIVANVEFTNLENNSVSSQYRDFNIWYTHPVIRQGFTHRGQELGTAIGPGSSNQMISVSYYEKRGMFGLMLGRQVHHNDRLFKNREYYRSTLPRPWMTLRYIHEVEIYYGLQALLFLPYDLELQFDYRFGKIENRHNLTDWRSSRQIFFDESNRHLAFTLRYRMQRW
jgi:hypothetical protein